jgi:hypothetical protein
VTLRFDGGRAPRRESGAYPHEEGAAMAWQLEGRYFAFEGGSGFANPFRWAA